MTEQNQVKGTFNKDVIVSKNGVHYNRIYGTKKGTGEAYDFKKVSIESKRYEPTIRKIVVDEVGLSAEQEEALLPILLERHDERTNAPVDAE